MAVPGMEEDHVADSEDLFLAIPTVTHAAGVDPEPLHEVVVVVGPTAIRHAEAHPGLGGQAVTPAQVIHRSHPGIWSISGNL